MVFELKVNNAEPYDLAPSIIWCNNLARGILHVTWVSVPGGGRGFGGES